MAPAPAAVRSTSRTHPSSCTLEPVSHWALQTYSSRTAGRHPAPFQNLHPCWPGSQMWQRSTSRHSHSCTCPVPHCSHRCPNPSISLLLNCFQSLSLIRLRRKHSCPHRVPSSRFAQVLYTMKLILRYHAVSCSVVAAEPVMLTILQQAGHHGHDMTSSYGDQLSWCSGLLLATAETQTRARAGSDLSASRPSTSSRKFATGAPLHHRLTSPLLHRASSLPFWVRGGP